MPPKQLREGFTTGTAATAAALAALLAALGEPADAVFAPLPPFEQGLAGAPAGRLRVPVLFSALAGPGRAEAVVRKDGGDDPDATRHALIRAETVFHPGGTDISVAVEGGEGIGRVTLPGLPVPVGQAAINPVPRLQIEYALREALRARGLAGRAEALLSVPGGAEMARRTLNARLGIVGGISILGTHGVVRPFSHEAWRETIRQGLAVARASGCPGICLSTGRRSEKLLMGRYPGFAPQAFVQAADFAGFSLREAGECGFSPIVWGCFFGKMLKLAQGLEYTHAGEAPLDMGLLAGLCARKAPALAADIKKCVTANHALDLLLENNNAMEIIDLAADMAAARAASLAGRQVRLHLFHLNGTEILIK